jgi:hypothetical protein
LVYPHSAAIGCPQAIGRNLAQRLSKRWDVEMHQWESVGRLAPDAETALIGHPHPSPFSIFRRSASQPGWGRVILLCPFNADPRQVAWLEPLVERADEYVAITGPYWFRAIKGSPFARWLPRMRRQDLAVDRRDFPRIKRRFAAKGKRRFLYIGHEGWPKNTAFLSRLARQRPAWDFAWMGSGKAIPGVRSLGRQDFARADAKRLVAGFDFMITVGSADANPTTILEAMAWGLLPVCTPQSGYEGMDGIVNVPLDDDAGALRVLDGLQDAADARLKAWVRKNDGRLKSDYTWDGFAANIVRAIEGRGRAPLAPRPAGEALRLTLAGLGGPNRAWRLRWAGAALRSWIRG